MLAMVLTDISAHPDPRTTHSSVAAAGHFVDAQRLVGASPLVSNRGEWDHQARLATIHALSAIAASLLEPAS